MWSVVAVAWAVFALGMLVFMINASRLTKSAPRNWFPMEAERAFMEAQHQAQLAFEDPTMGPHSHEFFWRVMRALDRWEEWQGRKLSTLKNITEPTVVEWHALSLANSLPADQPAPYVH